MITLFWTCKDGSKHQLFNYFNNELAAKNYANSIPNLLNFQTIDYEQIQTESDKSEIIFCKNHPELNP